MRKLVAFLFVCGFAVAVVSCGQKADKADAGLDTMTVSDPAPIIDTTATDSATVVPVDTTIAK